MTHTSHHTATAILNFLAEYQSEHRHAPSYREIGRAVGIRSTDRVSRELHQLASAGRIALEPHRTRSIRVLQADLPRIYPGRGRGKGKSEHGDPLVEMLSAGELNL